jgi:hypothetical protein
MSSLQLNYIVNENILFKFKCIVHNSQNLHKFLMVQFKTAAYQIDKTSDSAIAYHLVKIIAK